MSTSLYIYAINIVFCKIYILGRLFVYFLCQLDLHKFFNQIWLLTKYDRKNLNTDLYFLLDTCTMYRKLVIFFQFLPFFTKNIIDSTTK